MPVIESNDALGEYLQRYSFKKSVEFLKDAEHAAAAFYRSPKALELAIKAKQSSSEIRKTLTKSGQKKARRRAAKAAESSTTATDDSALFAFNPEKCQSPEAQWRRSFALWVRSYRRRCLEDIETSSMPV